MIPVPIFLESEDQLVDEGNNYLFHYTNAKSFFKILEDMTLKLSSFNKLNDINEANLSNFDMNHDFLIKYNAEQYIKNKCSLLCFTQNHKLDSETYIKGYNHPAMWSHYANNRDGVCIVIDKTKFKEINKEVFKNSFFYTLEEVQYEMQNANDLELKTGAKSPQDFVKDNYRQLIFYKHIDWNYEDEVRLFIMGYTGKLSIKGSVKYIVLGDKFVNNVDRMQKLVNLLIEPQLECYKQFVPHSFAKILFSQCGYDIMNCAFKIMEIINKQNNRIEKFRNYEDWLKVNFNY